MQFVAAAFQCGYQVNFGRLLKDEKWHSTAFCLTIIAKKQHISAGKIHLVYRLSFVK